MTEDLFNTKIGCNGHYQVQYTNSANVDVVRKALSAWRIWLNHATVHTHSSVTELFYQVKIASNIKKMQVKDFYIFISHVVQRCSAKINVRDNKFKRPYPSDPFPRGKINFVGQFQLSLNKTTSQKKNMQFASGGPQSTCLHNFLRSFSAYFPTANIVNIAVISSRAKQVVVPKKRAVLAMPNGILCAMNGNESG